MASNISSEIHIALCVDDNYLPYCCCTIESIISNNNAGNKIIFYIIYFSDVKGIELIIEHINKAGYRAVDIEVSESRICNFQTHHHFTSSVYLRLLLPNILPKNIERVLYLDSDLIVISDLTNLFNVNLGDFSTAMVPELAMDVDKFRRYEFNSGVMVIDLKSWRSNDLSKKVMDYIESYKGRLVCVDQSAINAILWEKTKPLDIKWNLVSTYFNQYEKFQDSEKLKIRTALDTPKIIHFTTGSKPWLYLNEHPYKRKFYSYLRNTPFRNEKEKNKNLKTILKKFRKRVRKIVGIQR